MLNYKSTLVQLLGLPPEATDDEIVENADTAVRGAERLQNRLAQCAKSRETLDNSLKELKAKHDVLLNSVIDGDLETFKEVIGEEKDAWKTDLMANRGATIKRLESLSKRMNIKPKTPLYNAATAGTPDPVTAEVRGSEDLYARARIRALERVKNREAKTFTLAFQEECALIK